jgi:hypothetical protein
LYRLPPCTAQKDGGLQNHMARNIPKPAIDEKSDWLPDMDLNHDKQIQSLLCYRYTIGQTGLSKVVTRAWESRLPLIHGSPGLQLF